MHRRLQPLRPAALRVGEGVDVVREGVEHEAYRDHHDDRLEEAELRQRGVRRVGRGCVGCGGLGRGGAGRVAWGCMAWGVGVQTGHCRVADWLVYGCRARRSKVAGRAYSMPTRIHLYPVDGDHDSEEAAEHADDGEQREQRAWTHGAWGCSLGTRGAAAWGYIGLQPGTLGATAWSTEGCSLGRPGPHGIASLEMHEVAAWATWGCSLGKWGGGSAPRKLRVAARTTKKETTDEIAITRKT